jgi:hypothetical protein
VFDRILIAQVGWADHYQGEEGLSGFAGGDYFERFNFRRARNGRFYGAVPSKAPKPKVPDGWLVLFIARENGTGPWCAVGWYENATFEAGDQPGISQKSKKYGKPFRYSVHTDAKNAYLICSKLRALFPAPTSVHFGDANAKFVYARNPEKPRNEPWRIELAEFAETVASGQIPAKP